MLHGAGARAEAALQVARPFVEETGAIALAIDSLGVTWDVIIDKLGPDVAFLDAALERTFSEYAIDRSCIGVSGFSDGASYALTLGLANGDLFDGVVAFSPGFAAPVVKRENVRIFISHGTRDAVLPIESCSRRLVPILKALGHDVTYREFDGPHTVPPEVAREAMAWLAAPSRSA